MKRMWAAITAVMGVSASILVAVAPATPAFASESMLESFEGAPAATWMTLAGSPTVAAATSATEGSGALRIGYSLSAGNAEVTYRATPPVYSGPAPTSILLDVRGDGTYNTLYLRVRDAAGESFIYRVENLNVTDWRTVAVSLAQPPAAVSGGDGNRVLDLPLSVDRLSVARNGSQPANGWVEVDALRLTSDDWSAPMADRARFWSLGGQSATVSFTAAGAGDYQLVLRDTAGLTRTLAGQATVGTNSFVWDGTSDSGSRLSGNVAAVLSYDLVADGSLVGPISVGTPYLVGVTTFGPAPTGSAVGVNSFMTTLDTPAAVDAEAALLEAAHVRLAREEFEWNRVEPRQGYFDWVKFDRAVELASARGVEIVGKLVYSAVWASSAPAGTPSADVKYYPPTDMAAFAAYARAVVERYKDTVKVWEVWNEPNHPSFWKPTPNASRYASLLTAAYAAIKAADPTATVLGGALAGFDEKYMAAVHAAGAGASYDALAIHTYVAGPPEASAMSLWIDGALGFLDRTGNGSKRLWITELGWSTCTNGCAAGVTEANQASYLEHAYLDAIARGVRGVMWFSMKEYGTSTGVIDNYGLVEASGRTKPAYAALSKIGAALDDSVGIGSIAPTADGLFYIVDDMATGSYPVTPLGGGSGSMSSVTARHGGTAGQRLTYSFTGASTGVEIAINKTASGQPKALSVWVYGDGSNSPVWMRVRDASGEYFEAKVGHASDVSWRRLTFYFDGGNPNYRHWGGNNNGTVDYPVTVTSLIVYRPSIVQFGQIHIDDITAHYGFITRGLVSLGRGKNIQAAYSLTNQTIGLPVSGTSATLLVGGQDQPLPLTGGKATVQIGPATTAVVSSTAGLTSPPAVAGTSTEFNWRGGDRAVYTVQIYAANGALVRTLTGNEPYDAGRRAATWKGNLLDGSVAPPGEYVFRLTLYGNDGRRTYVDLPFTLTAP